MYNDGVVVAHTSVRAGQAKIRSDTYNPPVASRLASVGGISAVDIPNGNRQTAQPFTTHPLAQLLPAPRRWQNWLAVS